MIDGLVLAGPVDAVLVSDPEAIEQVLIRDHQAYRKHAFLREAVGEAFGEGLLTSDGDHWRKHRTLSQPAFRSGQLAAYAGTMVQATERRLGAWPEEGRVEVAAEMMELTLVIAAKTLFDVDLDEEVQAIEEALDALVTEAMRLYPPAWAIGREPIEDTDRLGHRVPEGTQLMMSQWGLHRDPRFYEDPEAFTPERWTGGRRMDELPRFAYFPFGGGPRTCIGNTFALLEARLVLATLLQAYEVAPLGEMPTPAPSITLRPEGETGLSVRSRR